MYNNIRGVDGRSGDGLPMFIYEREIILNDCQQRQQQWSSGWGSCVEQNIVGSNLALHADFFPPLKIFKFLYIVSLYITRSKKKKLMSLPVGIGFASHLSQVGISSKVTKLSPHLYSFLFSLRLRGGRFKLVESESRTREASEVWALKMVFFDTGRSVT